MPEVRHRPAPAGPVLESGALRLAVRLDEGTFSLGNTDTHDDVVPSAWTGVVLADGVSLASRGVPVLSWTTVRPARRGATSSDLSMAIVTA